MIDLTIIVVQISPVVVRYQVFISFQSLMAPLQHFKL